MRVLLISTYELGHQPLHVASPAATLQHAGHEVRALDASVQELDPAMIDWAQAVGISVPMHTAMRLAARAAAAIRERRPDLPLCAYGLYAPMASEAGFDRAIAGEYEPALLAWLAGVGHQRDGHGSAEAPLAVRDLGRHSFQTPARDLLPSLTHYAHLEHDGATRPVGYVETSHGCAHRCRHCPVPAVYGGRVRIVQRESVLEDIARLARAGAEHITFGDPDFLNGVKHSLDVAEEMHARFPRLTFDCTVKVEHILEHAEVWARLRAAGCLFVVSALECVNDGILRRLDKGHTASDAATAIALLRSHGIETRPSWLPFTPWSTPRDVADILDFVAAHDLIANVDPVQYAIRLLIPRGSLLLENPDFAVGPYDPERLTHTWTAEDPAADALQQQLAALVAEATAAEEDPARTFARIRATVTGGTLQPQIPMGETARRPRLTEPWFC
jgi:radical SAM superfamily enzyme YgiQ (UPF0313 family)